MTRTPIASANIAAVGYDLGTRTLEVEFRNGSIYRYEDVSPQVHADLIGASSVGRYFDTAIRHGGYAYKRVIKED